MIYGWKTGSLGDVTGLQRVITKQAFVENGH